MSDPSQNPQTPGEVLAVVDDVFNGLLESLESNIGRWVAFALTPILLPVVGAVAYWLQDKLGIDLQTDPAAVTAYIVTVVGGLAGVIITWLRNRGKHEVAAVETVAAMRAAEDAVAAHAARGQARGMVSGGPVSPDRSV